MRATVLRSTPAYRKWLADLSGFTRFPGSVVVDQALRAYARQVGFPDPPARTTPRTKSTSEEAK
jgi:hypothetical protein